MPRVIVVCDLLVAIIIDTAQVVAVDAFYFELVFWLALLVALFFIVRGLARFAIRTLSKGARLAIAILQTGGFNLLRPDPFAPPHRTEKERDPLSLRELLASGGFSALRGSEKDDRQIHTTI